MTIIDLARECGAQSANVELVLKKMIHRIGTDSKLRSQLFDELIRSACLRTIYGLRHDQRREIKFNPAWNANAKISSAVASVATRSILDSWQLQAKSEILGNATASELQEEIAFESSLANGHMENVRFYSAITAKLAPGEKVRQRFNDKQLRKILTNVRTIQQSGAA